MAKNNQARNLGPQRVHFASRQDEHDALMARVGEMDRTLRSIRTEIIRCQAEQVERSDATIARLRRFPSPSSRAGQRGLDNCTAAAKHLRKQTKRVLKARKTILDQARAVQETIAAIEAASYRPPVRKGKVRTL